MTRLFSTVAAVAVLGGTALVGSVAVASTSECASGRHCGWAYNDYSDLRWSYSISQSYLNPGMDNVADSFMNNGNVDCARVYAAFGYAGEYTDFNRPGLGGTTRDPNLSNGGGTGAYSGQNWANRISAVRLASC